MSQGRVGELADSWQRYLHGHAGDPPIAHALTRFAMEEGSTTTFERVEEGLDSLAGPLLAHGDAPTAERLARLVHHLFVAEGFVGDRETYDHPANSCIDQVLVRRKGLPILLSLLTVEVGQRFGLDLDGIGFPGHFLVGTRGPSRLFVDPFHGGALRTLEDLRPELARQLGRAPTPEELQSALQPTPTRDILLRMCNNLVRAWQKRGDLGGVLRNLDRRVGLRPEIPELVRDRGLLAARLGLREAASEDLQDYLARRPDADDARRVSLQLTMLLR